MQPVIMPFAEFLLSSAQGTVAVGYWACEDDGSGVEPIGLLAAHDLATQNF